jgi:deoxyhypusine synthase
MRETAHPVPEGVGSAKVMRPRVKSAGGRSRLSLRRSGLLPVKDYHVKRSKDVATLLDEMGSGGGFAAKDLWTAANILKAMCEDKGCVKFLSIPAAPIATGLRGVIIDMIRSDMVDVMVTTCGCLDHDIARTLGKYYHGSFDMDDADVRRAGFHRLGNILVPLESYGPAVERHMAPLLERLYEKGEKRVSTEHLSAEIGRSLDSEDSLLYWAQKKRVPVFVPGVTDGAVGSQLWLFSERHRDFQVDLLADERRLSEIVFDAKSTGAMVIGGGISKHHVIWWNMFHEGLDYAGYVTTAAEYDGSLSGAEVKEAISWGKVKERARKVTLHAEATTVLPLIVSYALSRPHRIARAT